MAKGLVKTVNAAAEAHRARPFEQKVRDKLEAAGVSVDERALAAVCAAQVDRAAESYLGLLMRQVCPQGILSPARFLGVAKKPRAKK